MRVNLWDGRGSAGDCAVPNLHGRFDHFDGSGFL